MNIDAFISQNVIFKIVLLIVFLTGFFRINNIFLTNMKIS